MNIKPLKQSFATSIRVLEVWVIVGLSRFILLVVLVKSGYIVQTSAQTTAQTTGGGGGGRGVRGRGGGGRHRH